LYSFAPAAVKQAIRLLASGFLIRMAECIKFIFFAASPPKEIISFAICRLLKTVVELHA
jgi:hypothetical protein